MERTHFGKVLSFSQAQGWGKIELLGENTNLLFETNIFFGHNREVRGKRIQKDDIVNFTIAMPRKDKTMPRALNISGGTVPFEGDSRNKSIHGVIESFDANRGWGWISSAYGCGRHRYFFHVSQLRGKAMNSHLRHATIVKQRVSFVAGNNAAFFVASLEECAPLAANANANANTNELNTNNVIVVEKNSDENVMKLKQQLRDTSQKLQKAQQQIKEQRISLQKVIDEFQPVKKKQERCVEICHKLTEVCDRAAHSIEANTERIYDMRSSSKIIPISQRLSSKVTGCWSAFRNYCWLIYAMVPVLLFNDDVRVFGKTLLKESREHGVRRTFRITKRVFENKFGTGFIGFLSFFLLAVTLVVIILIYGMVILFSGEIFCGLWSCFLWPGELFSEIMKIWKACLPTTVLDFWEIGLWCLSCGLLGGSNHVVTESSYEVSNNEAVREVKVIEKKVEQVKTEMDHDFGFDFWWHGFEFCWHLSGEIWQLIAIWQILKLLMKKCDVSLDALWRLFGEYVREAKNLMRMFRGESLKEIYGC